jgi:acyl transferase domain-containing protein
LSSSSAPVTPASAGHRHHVLALSAATTDALAVARERLAAYLEARPEVALADVAHTLDRGRERFAHRFAVVVAGREEAVRALRDGRALPHTVSGPAPAVVFAFPETTERPAEALTLQVRLAERFAEWGVTPAAVYGVGTGRIAAAVVSGALGLEEGRRFAADASATVPVPDRPTVVWSTALGPVTPDGPAPREEHLAAEAEPDKLLRPARDRLGEVTVLDVPAADLDDEALLTALAALWCEGVEARLTPAGPARRLRLPGHPLSWAHRALPDHS